MRSAASRRSVASLSDLDQPWLQARSVSIGIEAARALLLAGPQPQQVADRVNEVGAVHGVKVKIGDAVVDKIEHLLGGDGRGDELARRRIVIEPVEAGASQSGTAAPARAAKFLVCLKFCTGRMPGTIGIVDAAAAHAVEIAEIKAVLEKELSDRARRAGVDFGLEHVDVGRHGGAVRMFFRIGRNRDLDVGDALDAGDKIGGVAITFGMRRKRSPTPPGGSPRSATMWRTPACA